VHAPSLGSISIDRNIFLDGRLALFHRRQGWLVVADLHFGYELSQRAAGNLFPLWGMQNIEGRLLGLLGDFQPRQLILLGDLVHDRSGSEDFFELVRRLETKAEVILISGNHDRDLKNRKSNGKHPILESWRTDGFYFHHGDCTIKTRSCIQIIGHHHPTGCVRDGAGLKLKLPAFVQRKNCWIMPAFSPWAAGADWFDANGESKIWLCSPERVFQVS
jgi:DNA ligase-associated metallophosphoesterase